MNVAKDTSLLRELGAKLANFRRKLAIAIGQKKITQPEFCEMYGAQIELTPRMITSYETGDVDPPGSLLYLLWKEGNSIDAIFNEGSVTGEGRENARKLFDNCVMPKLKELTKTEREQILKELKKNADPMYHQNDAIKTSIKRKASNAPPSETKKR